jgi:hypothetical protein
VQDKIKMGNEYRMLSSQYASIQFYQKRNLEPVMESFLCVVQALNKITGS